MGTMDRLMRGLIGGVLAGVLLFAAAAVGGWLFYCPCERSPGGWLLGTEVTEPVVEIWDIAALIPIVEEAGGRVTDRSGARRADGGNAVTTNGLLHDDVLQIVGTGS